MSDSKTLRIDYCRNPVGALSRWLWAAHEGKPHNFDRAEVRLDAETAGRVAAWIAGHRLGEGRVLEITSGEPVCSFDRLFDDGRLVDLSLYWNAALDDEQAMRGDKLDQIVNGYTPEELVAKGVIVARNDGEFLAVHPFYPIDEFRANYIQMMQENILAMLENELTHYSLMCAGGTCPYRTDQEAAPRFKQAALELVAFVDSSWGEHCKETFLLPWDRSELERELAEAGK